MKITLNGKEKEIDKELTISEFLQQNYVETQEYVTVQLNDSIIPKSDYDSNIIKEGAVIELLYYMGGGCK
ncbi:sulfur carrier protein ThiS [Ruminiclostridium josui]|uniref:sulfur carrier protein ThiS n=1 Tax=Ruminiclostridium josui TaxID=1499 RepID=UPI000466262E|nr:sulfur carrier protein ThiS [Ruminiclostridium josui]